MIPLHGFIHVDNDQIKCLVAQLVKPILYILDGRRLCMFRLVQVWITNFGKIGAPGVRHQSVFSDFMVFQKEYLSFCYQSVINS